MCAKDEAARAGAGGMACCASLDKLSVPSLRPRLDSTSRGHT